MMTRWQGANGSRGEDDGLQSRRRAMVREQLVARGIGDPAVLAAMESVPRHRFVPPAMERHAYADGALAIGFGQTISQPYIVALMTELLRLDGASRLLEVGTGSGYQAAVAACIAAEVWSVERMEELSRRAAAVLTDIGVHNVHLVVGDGSRGLPEQAPFDAVIVTAAAESVPPALLAQLGDGGRLVVPVGPVGHTQILTVFARHGDAFQVQEDIPCRFVPLIEGPRPPHGGGANHGGDAAASWSADGGGESQPAEGPADGDADDGSRGSAA
jgi:protein-L-isoaspartate(D-aspartate) O-methyltransferase